MIEFLAIHMMLIFCPFSLRPRIFYLFLRLREIFAGCHPYCRTSATKNIVSAWIGCRFLSTQPANFAGIGSLILLHRSCMFCKYASNKTVLYKYRQAILAGTMRNGCTIVWWLFAEG